MHNPAGDLKIPGAPCLASRVCEGTSGAVDGDVGMKADPTGKQNWQASFKIVDVDAQGVQTMDMLARILRRNALRML